MTTEEETIIYDALCSLNSCAAMLCLMVNANGTPAELEAYRNGIYATAIKLQVVLGTDGIARGKERYAKRDAECRAYFQTQSATDQRAFCAPVNQLVGQNLNEGNKP